MQCFYRQNRYIRHNRCFFAIVIRYDNAFISGIFGGQSHGKRTLHRFNSTVQGQLAQDKIFGYDVLGNDLGCRKYP